MREERNLRFPVEVGLAALDAVTAAAFAFTLAVCGAGVAIWLLLRVELGHVFFWCLAVAVFFGGVVRGLVRSAWKRRPADLVFLDEGLRVEGGPKDALLVRWADLEGCPGQPDEAIFVLQETNGTVHALAELESDVAGALRTAILARRSAAEAEPASAETHVLDCPGCGAAVAPALAPKVACVHCGAQVSIPDRVQQRLASAAPSPETTRDALVVARLFAQPTAASALGRLAIASGILAGGLLISAGLFTLEMFRPNPSFWVGLGAAVLPALFLLDAYFVARAHLADRAALGPTAIGFAARPPARAGGPRSCRACLAPLYHAETLRSCFSAASSAKRPTSC